MRPSDRSEVIARTTVSREAAIELASSRVLPRLRSVDLALGCLTDRGAEAILARADRFRHLEELRLKEEELKRRGRRDRAATRS